MKKIWGLMALLLFSGVTARAVTWSFDWGEAGHESEWAAVSNAMEQLEDTYNTYTTYNIHFNTIYSSGIPTAQSDYNGQIGFGGIINYRVAMHESSHYLGTGTIYEWTSMNHYRTAASGRAWNGTYAMNLRRAFDGPSERMGGDGMHYWPYGANYDSEGVDAPRMLGIIGAYRRDMGLDDQTIGIASGTYRLRNRVSTLTLDSLGVAVESSQVSQNDTTTADDNQLWVVTLQEGTPYFTIENVGNGLCLDSLTGTNGAAVGMTTLSTSPTDSQLWTLEPTDSFFFKIVNKANGRGLDTFGEAAAGSGLRQYDAAGNGSWNMQWTFKHPYAQTVPEAGVVSQGRPARCSSVDGAYYAEKGNNGVSENFDCSDRWTASGGSYPQWWHVDLGVEQPVTQVEVDWFPGGVFQYEVQVSSDGSSWTTVKDRTGNAQGGTTVDTLTDVFARYVRINITGTSGGGWAAFMECRVYNESEGSQLLSMNRPSTSSSEQIGNLAVNANDVDSTYTRWCASSSSFPAWWQVDLGEVQNVNRALINWFDDGGRTYQYRIEGSTNNVDFFTLIDRTGNTTSSSTADTFDGEARYVRITVTGSSSGWPSFYDAQIYSTAAVADMPPAAPTGLAASSDGLSVDLTWNANTEDDLTGYTVYRSLTSGSGYTALASNLTATSFADTDVSDSEIYFYVVTASDTNAFESSFSGEATAAIGTLGTIAYWDFNDSSLGAADGAAVPDSDSMGVWRTAAVDKSGNGNHLTSWDHAWAGFNWSTNSPQGDYSLIAAGTYPAAYTWSSQSGPSGFDVESVPLNDFTVEVLATTTGSGERTAVGRDARNVASATADRAAFYLKINGANHPAVVFVDENGTSVSLEATDITVANDDATWYHWVVVKDGEAVSLYVDGQLEASTTVSGLGALAKGTTSAAGSYHAGGWTVGRGLYAGGHTDRFYGHIDAVAISAEALAPDAFVISLDDTTAPAAPTGLVADAGDGSVGLSWTGGTEDDFASYTVYRSTASGSGYAALVSGLTTNVYSDSSVTNDTAYYYVVTALDDLANESDASAEVSATPADATAPAAPTGLAAVPGDGSVALDWNDSGEADFASYQVYRSISSRRGFVVIASGMTDSVYTDGDAENGATYYYRVTALDASANESVASGVVSAALVADVSPEEYHIAGYSAAEEGILSMTVSNTVPGHLYSVLTSDTLTPPVWTTNTVASGTGSNLVFDLTIDAASTNQFYKLDVQRQ